MCVCVCVCVCVCGVCTFIWLGYITLYSKKCLILDWYEIEQSQHL